MSFAILELQSNPHFTFVNGSINDPAAVDELFHLSGKAKVVYHLAAQASAHSDAAPAEYTEKTNLVAPRMIMDAMLVHGCDKIVFGSSFRVYGPRPIGQIDENSRYGSFSDLSHLSKVYVEKLMEMYSTINGLSCIPVRIGVVYGPAPVMKSDYRFMTVPNKFCLQAIRGETLTVNPAGTALTPFVHVDDAVEAMILASKHLTGYAPANAATEACSVPEVAGIVQDEAIRHSLNVKISGNAASAAGSLDIVSVLDGLGFRPKWTLRRAIPHILNRLANCDRSR